MLKSQKDIIYRYLCAGELDELQECLKGDRSSFRALIPFLLHPETVIRWRAAEALGKLSGEREKTKPNSAKETIRRLFWGMNDESGNLIWAAPEAIAEILWNVPKLIDEFGSVLASHFDLEPFEAGVHWGVARLTARQPAVFAEFADSLKHSLHAADPAIRAYSVIALGNIVGNGAKKAIAPLLDDSTTIYIYDLERHELRETSVAEICREVLNNIEQKGD
ncbi:MAG: DVU0298 family protein [bacterium]